jgi:hypothetical protein
MSSTPFHLSLPCYDVEQTKDFYINKLGAVLGRNSNNWLDVNLFGNQITFTKSGKFDFYYLNYSFEGKILPSFHYGIIVSDEVLKDLYSRLNANGAEVFDEITFLKEKKGEHTSFFVKDPNGYMVEFKSFHKPEDIFEDE